MTLWVVDASVAVKWFVPEVHHLAAKRVRPFENDVIAPDFLPIELANALIKKMRRREISEEVVREGLETTAKVVRRLPSFPLMDEAIDIALRYQRSIYDSLYVALALQEACPLVTADRRLYEALRPSLQEALLWVEDLPP